MKVFVCIATTLNGLITAGVPHDEWISDASWKSYLERLQSTDVAIIGSKTYKFMDDEEFPPNLKYIVLSHHQESIKLRDNVTISQDSPQELIQQLAQEGHKSVGVFGGSEVISSYLEAGVVDELFVDIESIISGSGKNLVLPDVGIHRFQLVEVKKLDAGAAQLHYTKKSQP